MPKLPPKVLDCVCYLYDSEEDAKAGRNFGGTGFLLAFDSEKYPRKIEHYYVVTNWHVACRGSSVIRINTKDSGTDIIPYGPEQWEFFPDLRYDLAIAPMPLKRDVHQYTMLTTDHLVTKKNAEEVGLGPGEDVFMVGRFVDHDGGQVNLPAVRFGNISVMPTPIEQPTGRMADAFCIDLHSRTGYSGSPVFVYRAPGYDLGDVPKENESRKILLSGISYLMLLGIHFSQFKELWEVVETDRKKAGRESAHREPLITEGKYIQGLSGMTCVLPAWIIREALDLPNLKKMREINEDRVAKQLNLDASVPVAESVAPPASDEKTTHREDFNSLLSEAARKPEPEAGT